MALDTSLTLEQEVFKFLDSQSSPKRSKIEGLDGIVASCVSSRVRLLCKCNLIEDAAKFVSNVLDSKSSLPISFGVQLWLHLLDILWTQDKSSMINATCEKAIAFFPGEVLTIFLFYTRKP